VKNPGVYAQSRAIFDHPMFKDEPFTEREAWSWMCGAAAFKPMTVRVAGFVIDLERGQLAFSQRFLERRFKWSRQKVRGFLAKLGQHESIIQIPTKGVTKIIICNYDKYAFGQPSEQPKNNQATTSERPKEEELKELKATGEDARASERDAWDIADAFLEAIGVDRDDPGWFGVRRRAEVWRAAGWSREFIVATAKKIMSRRSDVPHINFFETVFASDFASQSRPLPEGKKGQDNGKHRQQGGSPIPAADAIIAGLAKFNEPAPSFDQPGERAIRGGEGARVVRLLPKG
jgi:hypothetical protein